jgi:2-amino-4-hydroxy-6-hydroxymethyldihydropteridine diphosphokinase
MMNNASFVVYLGLGSNLGDRHEYMRMTLDFLAERMKIEKLSPIYETKPVGEKNQPDFLNMVCRVSTRLSPSTLLFMVKGIEAKLGRVPVDSPRPIDIDILFYADQIINTPPQLIVPHPRLHERGFVLFPMADIAPDLVHPILKKTVKQLLDELPDKNGVIKMPEQSKAA